MIRIEKLEECCGCEACANVCPKKCIQMETREGFYYPKVDDSLCVDCGLCEKVCPLNNAPIISNQFEKKGIAARIKDNESRFNSTSGGAAYLLTKKIVESGGVAYGIVFDAQFQTVFGRIETEEEIVALQGSKYPQCRIGDGFKVVRRDLESGRSVIVFGTPCQIQGLTRFLRKEYSNLFLVDLICHGVPSPVIWKEYLGALFPQERIQKVVFKHKMNGWKNWNVFIQSENITYIKERTDDLYMSSYLCGFNVRPSCFSCKFKGENRSSDITIADAWGIPEKDSVLNDGKGLSTVIVNTLKGSELVKSIESEMVFRQYSITELTSGNGAYHTCIVPNMLRDAFFKRLKKRDVISVLQKYSINTLLGKVSTRLTGMLHRRR